MIAVLLLSVDERELGRHAHRRTDGHISYSTFSGRNKGWGISSSDAVFYLRVLRLQQAVRSVLRIVLSLALEGVVIPDEKHRRESWTKMGFSGTKVMEVVIKQSGGLVWKNWPMNHTRRANAKKRHVRLRQVESVLKACAGPAPSKKTQSCSTESTDSQPSASLLRTSFVGPSGICVPKKRTEQQVHSIPIVKVVTLKSTDSQSPASQ